MVQNNPQISIILPTYNESQNIVGMLKLIRQNIPKGISTETIVVDDNSPDGTGKIVEDYISSIKKIAEIFPEKWTREVEKLCLKYIEVFSSQARRENEPGLFIAGRNYDGELVSTIPVKINLSTDHVQRENFCATGKIINADIYLR